MKARIGIPGTFSRASYEVQPCLDQEHLVLAIFAGNSPTPSAELKLSLPEIRGLIATFEATMQKITENRYLEAEIARAQGKEREYLENQLKKGYDPTQSHIEDFE